MTSLSLVDAISTIAYNPAGIYGSQGRADFTVDDVEHYFNYMGMLAVEGTYDRMEEMLSSGVCVAGRAFLRSPSIHVGCNGFESIIGCRRVTSRAQRVQLTWATCGRGSWLPVRGPCNCLCPWPGSTVSPEHLLMSRGMPTSAGLQQHSPPRRCRCSSAGPASAHTWPM